MGRMGLEGMLDMTDPTDHTAHLAALEWHLQYNHYPPVPMAFVTVAEDAIAACLADDEYRMVPLPIGYSPEKLPAYKIVEALHLEPFLEQNP